jgi:DNA-binding GntR family transcriptional regulator
MSDRVRTRSLDDLKADLIAYISGGEFVTGMRLPSERDLMKRFSAGRHVLRHALDDLRAEGVIETEHGSGSRIVEPRPIYTELRTPDDPGQLVEPIDEPLEHRNEAPPAYAALFGIETGDPLFYLEQKGRHRVTGVRVLLSRYMPAEPWLELNPAPEPLGDRAPLLKAFADHFGPLNTAERIRYIETPSAETLSMLGADITAPPFPVIEVRRYHRTRRGRLLMLETHTSRAGALELQYEL